MTARDVCATPALPVLPKRHLATRKDLERSSQEACARDGPENPVTGNGGAAITGLASVTGMALSIGCHPDTGDNGGWSRPPSSAGIGATSASAVLAAITIPATAVMAALRTLRRREADGHK